MQFWISVWEKVAWIAASNPVKLSVQAMKISSTPRFFRLLSTVAQHLALSFSSTHMPRTSFRPSWSTPVDANGDIDRFLHDLPLVADMVVDGVQKHHGVNVHIPDREPRLHGELAPPCRKGAPLFHEQF